MNYPAVTIKTLISRSTKPPTMTIQEQFEQAVKASKNLPQRPGNDVLLQLYALYKQATEGDVQGEVPSNPFDFVAKAKYEAWAGISGKSKDQAMQEYVQLIEKLKS
jgi:diazepam-binding inhibitor (GABA receptor modulating acyl-CoA-binding protein)